MSWIFNMCPGFFLLFLPGTCFSGGSEWRQCHSSPIWFNISITLWNISVDWIVFYIRHLSRYSFTFFYLLPNVYSLCCLSHVLLSLSSVSPAENWLCGWDQKHENLNTVVFRGCKMDLFFSSKTYNHKASLRSVSSDQPLFLQTMLLLTQILLRGKKVKHQKGKNMSLWNFKNTKSYHLTW